MKNVIYTLSIMMVVFAITSCKERKRPKNYNHIVDEGSIMFVQQSLENSQAELQASKLAQTNSKDSRVLSFATRLILDQSIIGGELRQIALMSKISNVDSINGDHKIIIHNISMLRDTAFDRAYIQLMVNNRQRAVKNFASAATDKTEQIQKFARKALPTLRSHLDSANAICADLQ